jgi:DNA modification methylase
MRARCTSVNSPYLTDPDITLYQGDALEVLRELPSGSVHMACTSPPFWGLRDYQAAGQIGLEKTVDEWIANLVSVFAEVRRVLRNDATLWIEIGDSFSNKQLVCQPWRLGMALQEDGWILRSSLIWARPNCMPESVSDRPTTAHSHVLLLAKSRSYFYDAEALREPNFDSNTARWEAKKKHGTTTSGITVPGVVNPENPHAGQDNHRGLHGVGTTFSGWNPAGKNARTVWTIPTEPNALAICRLCDAYWQGGAPREHCGQPVVQHFAAFPRELVRRMILAGTSERGVCAECGAPWVRAVETTSNVSAEERAQNVALAASRGIERHRANYFSFQSQSQTLGWHPSCECSADVVPGRVLDCFSGSGTTLLVARQLGRHAIGVELNERYCAMTRARLAQLSLLSEVSA